MQHPYKTHFVYYRIPKTLVPRSSKGRPKSKYLHKYRRGDGWVDFAMPSRPRSKGGATICKIEDTDGSMVASMATCSLSDNFCYKIGRDISLGRALKLYEQL